MVAPMKPEPAAMQPTTVVISKTARANTTRPRVMEQLRQTGLDPILIESRYTGPARGAEHRRTGHQAARLAYGNHHGLLHVEDDIEINIPLMRRFLIMLEHDRRQAARAADDDASFYQREPIIVFCAVQERHHQPQARIDARFGRPMRPHFAVMPHYRESHGANGGFHGSMCVWIPPAIVSRATTDWHEFINHPVDDTNAPGMPADLRHLTEPVLDLDRQRGKITGFDFWLRERAPEYGGIMVATPNPVDHVGDNPDTERFRSKSYGWSTTL